MRIDIRKEQAADAPRIAEITQAAFENHPHGVGTEHLIVDALRNAGALALSLVAEADQQIVGHVAFSPVSISDGSKGWYGLGPVSVAPPWQGRGIGSALITEGLSMLRDAGAGGCVLMGEPAYYARFGFRNDPALILENVPQEYFLALAFDANSAQGIVSYHSAFSLQG